MSPEDMRTHFAAQAPAEIPAWFQPAMDHLPLPDMPSLPEALGGKAAEEKVRTHGLAAAAFHGTAYQEEANSYQTSWSEWRQQRRQVETQREAWRYFAWRWYFADEMLKFRDATIPPRPGG